MKPILFLKSLVSGYTRKDGTVVKPYSDRRTKRQAPTPGQMALFEDDKKLPPNRFKGVDPVAATPDMFGDAHHEINSMHSQMRAADEFSDKYLELSHQRSAALDKHVSAMLGRGEMAVFDMKDGKAAALHSSSKKDGGVQVTHYGKGGIMGDTQYDDVAAAIEGEDLWNYPLMHSDEADKVLGGSLSAEAKFQDQIAAAKRRLSSAKDDSARSAIEKEIRTLRRRAFDDDPIEAPKPKVEEPKRKVISKDEFEAMAAEHGYQYARGYRSMQDGYSMHPPSDVRKKTEKTEWERGWMAANGEKIGSEASTITKSILFLKARP